MNTTQEHIAQIRDTYNDPGTLPRSHAQMSALALCDDYEALAAAAREVLTPCEVHPIAGPRRGWCGAHNEYLGAAGCPMDALRSVLNGSPSCP